MLRSRLRRPSHATLIAYVALFFAMSGTAYAAATIGSPEVKDNSLLSVDLKDGAAVKGVDVVDNSLTGSDISETTLGGVAHRILYDTSTPTTSDPVPLTTIGIASPFTIKASCDGRSHTQATIYVRGPAGIARGSFSSLVNDDGPNVQAGGLGQSYPADSDTSILIVTGQTQFVRATVTIWFRSGNTLAELHAQIIADPRQGSTGCLILGTLTVAV